MQSGKLVKDDSDDSDSSTDEDEVKRGKVVDISDEALFAACGGMTGHKVENLTLKFFFYKMIIR